MTKPSLRETQQTLRGCIAIALEEYATIRHQWITGNSLTKQDCDKALIKSTTAILSAIKKRVPKKMKWSCGYQHQDCYDAERRGYNECIDDFTKGLE